MKDLFERGKGRSSSKKKKKKKKNASDFQNFVFDLALVVASWLIVKKKKKKLCRQFSMRFLTSKNEALFCTNNESFKEILFDKGQHMDVEI